MIIVDNILDDLQLTPTITTDAYIKTVCPFTHHEHDLVRPGFSVLRESGRWICFKGCGQGDLPLLVARIRKISVREANRWLILHGGESDYSVIPYLYTDKAVESPYRLEKAFRQDYERQSTTKMNSYILDRGFTAQTLKEWGVRYDPLAPAIVLPLFDRTGQHLVGIIRREIPGHPLADRYVTSPGCKKEKYLFGAQHHPGNGYVVVTEGPLDAMWLSQCGFKSAVALMGSTCSKEQQRQILGLAERVVIATDNDTAGDKLCAKITKELTGKCSVTRLKLPRGVKDVQEMASGQVKGSMKNALLGIY